MDESGPGTDPAQRAYIAPDENDIAYFGARRVVEAEKEYIRRRRGPDKNAGIEQNLSGIALSGGGIRSATFALGVLQALAHNRWLEKIDYLSTVSGGGYIGSSLTWLLSRDWQGQDGRPIHYGVRRRNFPYGTFPMSGDAPDAADREQIKAGSRRRYQGRMLRFLRQHAKYLTPGDGIDLMSFIAVILRGTFLSLFVYLSLLVLLFIILGRLSFFSPMTSLGAGGHPAVFNLAVAIAAISAGLFLFIALVYSLTTFWPFGRARANGGRTKQGENAYKWRRRYERIAGLLLKAILLTAILGVIPYIYEWVAWIRYRELVGFGSTLVGLASGIGAFVKTSSTKKGRIPLGMLVWVAAAALLFGLLFLAYGIALRVGFSLPLVAALSAVAVAVGWFANLNYISVHRYYRDRLMESFMPDVAKAVRSDCAGSPASKAADQARLHDMCGVRGTETGLDSYPMPYHIINTNIILVSSSRPKYRGRGGDNFILTPEYCGASATGWRPTRKFMAGRMTLATAMAISGAAVNPSTGVGGRGVTRQPFLSMLMGLLNIRLGYWAPNPQPDKDPPPFWIPNFLVPGLWELVFRGHLNEDSRFVQLSDGGHFENLGLYELVRRRLKLIIVCDGAADPGFAFGDLANAIQKVRVDFGALIDVTSNELKGLIPGNENRDADETGAMKFADRSFFMADIVYPDNEKGTLIYLKTTFFRELSADLYGYKQKHPQFPDEPTSDQFFNENQFEAYRELGFQTAWQMMRDPDVSDRVAKIGSPHRPDPPAEAV